MMKKSFILIGLLAMFLISTGCSGVQTSRLEMDYGTSVKLLKFNQTLNPEAEKNLKPAYGFDGEAADASVKEYRKSFEKAKEPTFIFNITNE